MLRWLDSSYSLPRIIIKIDLSQATFARANMLHHVSHGSKSNMAMLQKGQEAAFRFTRIPSR